jgi:hypothetical protein
MGKRLNQPAIAGGILVAPGVSRGSNTTPDIELPKRTTEIGLKAICDVNFLSPLAGL